MSIIDELVIENARLRLEVANLREGLRIIMINSRPKTFIHEKARQVYLNAKPIQDDVQWIGDAQHDHVDGCRECGEGREG